MRLKNFPHSKKILRMFIVGGYCRGEPSHLRRAYFTKLGEACEYAEGANAAQDTYDYVPMQYGAALTLGFRLPVKIGRTLRGKR